eukprot:Amastigsp_a201_582.p3 type:complete len:150 gc:universal Amastigsp_a201_582:488-39(-)
MPRLVHEPPAAACADAEDKRSGPPPVREEQLEADEMNGENLEETVRNVHRRGAEVPLGLELGSERNKVLLDLREVVARRARGQRVEPLARMRRARVELVERNRGILAGVKLQNVSAGVPLGKLGDVHDLAVNRNLERLVCFVRSPSAHY